MVNSISLKRHCPICGCAEGKPLGRLSFALFDDSSMPRELDVVACQDCDFVFYDMIGSREMLDDFYANQYFSAMYTAINDISYDPVAYRKDDPVTILKPFVKSGEVSICDIGCGRGVLLDVFHKEGYTNLHGVEPSPECVEFVRKRLGAEAKVGSIYDIPFDKGFDIIACTHVFEHLWDIKSAAASLSSKLKEGGIAYVEVPDIGGYASNDPVEHITFYEHINHFALSHLVDVFTHCQLSALQVGHSVLATTPPTPVIYGVFKKDSRRSADHFFEHENFTSDEVKNWFLMLSFECDNICREIAEKKQPVYIWGINLPIQKLLGMSVLAKCNIVGLIDRDERKQGRSINGINITGPEVLQNATEDTIVALWGGSYEKQIRRELENMGFKGHVITL